MDLDDVTDELYAMMPEEFTAARNDRAKQARAEGARELSQRIRSLPKPNTAAWVVNQLVRSHRDEVELLLDLGRELREVLADVEGDELRELTRKRYQLVSALVQQARAVAHEKGRRLTDEAAQAVRTTLEATLSDDESAGAVASARLTDTLEPTGFSVTAHGAGPGKSAKRPAPTDATVADLDAERQRRARQQAEREVASAEKGAQRARLRAERADEKLHTAQGARDDTARSAERLRRELEQMTADLETRDRMQEEAGRESEEAKQASLAAAIELAEARRRLESAT